MIRLGSFYNRPIWDCGKINEARNDWFSLEVYKQVNKTQPYVCISLESSSLKLDTKHLVKIVGNVQYNWNGRVQVWTVQNTHTHRRVTRVSYFGRAPFNCRPVRKLNCSIHQPFSTCAATGMQRCTVVLTGVWTWRTTYINIHADIV